MIKVEPGGRVEVSLMLAPIKCIVIATDRDPGVVIDPTSARGIAALLLDYANQLEANGGASPEVLSTMEPEKIS